MESGLSLSLGCVLLARFASRFLGGLFVGWLVSGALNDLFYYFTVS